MIVNRTNRDDRVVLSRLDADNACLEISYAIRTEDNNFWKLATQFLSLDESCQLVDFFEDKQGKPPIGIRFTDSDNQVIEIVRFSNEQAAEFRQTLQRLNDALADQLETMSHDVWPTLYTIQ